MSDAPEVRRFADQTLAFDIETVPRLGIEELPERERRRLERRARDAVSRTDAEEAEAAGAALAEALRRDLSLNPLTARIASLAVHAVETRAELVLVAAAARVGELADPAVAVSEPELLACFWDLVRGARRLVGFGSRHFDVPVILTRSALLGIPASVRLQDGGDRHIDLAEALAGPRRDRWSSLELAAFAFGIPAKRSGHGSEVWRLEKEGRLGELARYNLEDARATAELYRRLVGTFV